MQTVSFSIKRVDRLILVLRYCNGIIIDIMCKIRYHRYKGMYRIIVSHYVKQVESGANPNLAYIMRLRIGIYSFGGEYPESDEPKVGRDGPPGT